MPTLIKVYGPKGLIGCCDERCYQAVNKRCECCCGGVNHQQGLKKAISLTRSIYDAVIMQNVKEGALPLRVVRPLDNQLTFRGLLR